MNPWGEALSWLFLVAVLVLLAIAIRRERRRRSATLTRRVDELVTPHLGYLAEGPHRAVEASLTLLHRSGALEIEPNGRLRRTGEPPLTASRWDTAVLAVADGAQAARVPESPALTGSLRTLREDLTRWGYLVAADTQRTSNRGYLLIGLLVFCAVPSAVSVATAGNPVIALFGGLIILGALAATIIFTGNRLTVEGAKALAAIRKRHDHLRPRHRPAWQTYDAATAARAVALFGAGVMWDCDPELAQAAGIRRPGDTHRDSGGSCGSGGDCSGCGD